MEETAGTLLAIFRESLEASEVTLDSKFYAMGGDSLLAVRVVNEARANGINLSLRDLLVHQTVRALLQNAAGLQPGEAPDTTAAAPAAGVPAAGGPFSLLTDEDRERLPDSLQDALPASALQTGMLYLCETSQDPHLYHSVEGWKVCAPFDEDRFRAAVQGLTRRHPALRTSFDFGDLSVPAQLVWQQVEPELRVEHAESADQALLQVDDWRSLRSAAPLDWRTAPLVRFLVVTLPDSFHVALSAHHAVLDGWSFSRLAVELVHLYEAGVDPAAAERVAAVNARVQHDFIAAELAAAASAEAAEHWLAQAGDAAGLVRPVAPAHVVDAAERYELDLAADLVGSLSDAARVLGTSLKSVLLAAHASALGAWSGREQDLVTGLVFNTRPESEGSDRASGLFLNTLPVRFATVAGSWADLVRSADQLERTGYAHRHFPQALLTERLGRPAFQVVFNYMHFHAHRDLDEASATPIRGRWRRGKPSFAFHVNVEITGESGQLRIGFDPGFIARPSVEAYARTLHESLVRLAADPAGSTPAAALTAATSAAGERSELTADPDPTQESDQ
ncbi:condensation domain-containing protein [Streptomyces sp. LS1784]|uniref:condensation domain-containing protein n=1 Tax=Streptomyces sp. LS1784 TaxID=2851533 RepID=UPI001CCF2049|nr:condensation domain-containing protein [Streptomyces sp. LS1784]